MGSVAGPKIRQVEWGVLVVLRDIEATALP